MTKEIYGSSPACVMFSKTYKKGDDSDDNFAKLYIKKTVTMTIPVPLYIVFTEKIKNNYRHSVTYRRNCININDLRGDGKKRYRHFIVTIVTDLPRNPQIRSQNGR